MGLKKKVSIVREYTDIGKKGICCRPLLSRCTASQDDSAACKRWLQWARRGQTRVSSSLSSCCRIFWVTSQSLPRWCKGLRASLQDHLRRIHRLLSFGGFPSPPGRWRRGGLRGGAGFVVRSYVSALRLQICFPYLHVGSATVATFDF